MAADPIDLIPICHKHGGAALGKVTRTQAGAYIRAAKGQTVDLAAFNGKCVLCHPPVPVLDPTPEPTPVPAPTTTLHNLTFNTGAHENVVIGGPGEQVRHVSGAHDATFRNFVIRGGGSTDVMTLGGPCGPLKNVLFEDGAIQCNLGTENASHSLGLNNVGISTPYAGGDIENLTFRRVTFGANNGTRSGSPRMNVEVLCRASGKINLMQFLGCTFEASDETGLDIETDPQAPNQYIVIDGNLFKGGTTAVGAKWQQGICLELAPYTQVTNNVIYGAMDGCLQLYSRDGGGTPCYAVVTGNTFDGSKAVAPKWTVVHINASNVTFTGNTIISPNPDNIPCIILDGCHNVTITGNALHGQIVEINGASGNTIRNNAAA